MELLSRPRSFYGNWKRYWRRKRYERLDGAMIRTRKSMKVIRFGGDQRRAWKIKAVPKLRILKRIASPLKLLSKLKNAYVDAMLGLAGNANTTGVFGNKRVPRGRQVKVFWPSQEFEKRLTYEIYKNLYASRELSTME